MSFVTIKLSLEEYQLAKNAYSTFVIPSSGEYVDFVADYNGVIITGYQSNKTYRKITFKGDNASLEASRWVKDLPERKEKTKVKTEWIDLEEQVGSDEVGVGDFLLPMIVVASHVKRSDIRKLKEFGIDDSKKMSDTKIREIGPKVIREFEYSLLVIPNSKYNEMVDKGEHINSLKAKMHNRALANLLKTYPDIYKVYVDEFCSAEKYYSYLDEKDEPIVKNIGFKTKGESYFPSVALSSVIARYRFLLKRDELSEKYGFEFLMGASSKVDELAKKLLQKVGREEFDKLVKKDFKNYNRIVNEKEEL